ncbi:MAG: molybdenum cofactor guanylyltransferase [Hydrogenothermaceae bacterium]|nr:molybdenum cofactor guanylyltransferase [Hydrogenothermaceae bacterium]
MTINLHMIENLSCVILAGGQSKRMGQDKAFLNFYGKTFIRVIAEKLSKKCSQLIVSANKEEYIYRKELEGIDFDFVKDINPFEGPLNAVSSVSEYIKNDYVFIATCDTPFINENLIDLYLSIIDSYDGVIPIIDGKFQTLNTLYTKKALEKAKEVYKESKSLMSWIRNLNYFVPETKAIKQLDNALLTYKSINTPAQYEEFVIRKI